MLWLTEDADLRCAHENGRVEIVPSQDLVRINSRRVLVVPDPIGRPVSGCPFVGPGLKPCQTTITLRVGGSELVRILDHPVSLDTTAGLTDGSPGTFEYHVRDPGQQMVNQR